MCFSILNDKYLSNMMIAAHADWKYEKQPWLTEPDGVKINKWENLPL